jgi:predicted Rossmann fold flavoprotein
MQKKIVIIGGGASGFMGAITAAETFPEAKIILLEKNREVLGKVRISGGGRCNVTNSEKIPKKFSKNYPRGAAFLLKLFDVFDQNDTVNWFETRQVPLKIEKDSRMFPTTDKSETIIECLTYTARKLKIDVITSAGVKNIFQLTDNELDRFELELFSGEKLKAYSIQYAAGGSPTLQGYHILQAFGIQINTPVPSLFTFNVEGSGIIDFSGLSVANTSVKIVGQKLEADGPLLITHWGFSGPAILKLSAWGARILGENEYKFKILINWCNQLLSKELIESIGQLQSTNPKKIIQSNPLFGLPSRLWIWLCEQAEISKELLWLDISHKKKNKLLENLQNCAFTINGKSTFKEEFVTCGGVKLEEVNAQTLEAIKVPGLFFSGEILDIDAVTGGFNFQAAWTTGYIVGKNIGN